MTTSGAMSYRAEILALHQELSGDYVPYYPRLAIVLGSVNAAVLLSRLVSWTRRALHSGDPRHQDGWLWKSREELREETGLARTEQEGARTKLKSLGLLQEELRGMPARLHFRLDMDALGQRLGRHIGRPYHTWRWEDGAFLDEFLGRHRVVYRKLALACGSLAASIHLSHLVAWTRKEAQCSQVAASWEHWLTLERRAASILGLTPRAVGRARKRLIELGVIEERRERRLNARTQTRLVPGRLMSLVKDIQPLSWATKSTGFGAPTLVSTDAQHSDTKTCQQQIPKPANSDDQNLPTSRQVLVSAKIEPQAAPTLGLSDSLACARQDHPSIKTQLLPQTPSSALSAACGGGEEEITPPQGVPPTPPSDIQAPQGLQGEGLIYPGQLAQSEQAMALRLLQPVAAAERQVILDELCGQLLAKGAEGVRNPLGYLARLAQRWVAGEFVPTVAMAVARRREAAREEAARRREEAQARKASRMDRLALRQKLAGVMIAAGMR